MKSPDESILIAEIFDLEPEHAALRDEVVKYMEICQKLQATGLEHLKAVVELSDIATGKASGDVYTAAKAVRFALRDQGLVMLSASRQLANLSSKHLSLSEKMGKIISTDGDK
jgi:hypothetical protein